MPHASVCLLTLSLRATALPVLLWSAALVALPATALAAGPRTPPADAPPRLSSAAALVLDLNDGKTTLARGAAEPRSIASITKLMTAMVVLDEGQPLAQELDVGSDDVDTVKNTHSRLRRVATLTREDLLTAALLSSDNMAALALARHSLGGRAAFVQKMNDKARALGLADTAFVDPAGLSPSNRSTPQDLAKMVAAANGYAFIRNATTQPAALIHGLAYRNTNPWAADPLWGIQLSKTGFTNEAGRCIAVIMEVAGAQYSVVLLGAQSLRARARDLTAIRNWLHARQGSAAPALAAKAMHWEVDVANAKGSATAAGSSEQPTQGPAGANAIGTSVEAPGVAE